MNAIGDVIMIIPVARALVEQGFEVHWVCGKGVQALLECYPWITLYPVDERKILIGTFSQRVRCLVQLWSKLLFKNYELCATLNYDWRYRILTLPVRARRRLALSVRSRETTILAGRSCTDEYARLLFGIKDGFREFGLKPLRPDTLPNSPLPGRATIRRIAIVPGGAANLHKQLTLRRWPIELYVELANGLRKRNWEIVLLGGSEDDWVKQHFGHIEFIDCIGKLSLPEVISTFDTCDAVITHDTGPLHLAGLSRACLVGIFGPTDPNRFLPRRPGVIGIWGGQGFACRPCYDGFSFAPCEHAGCMYQITPNLVIRELDRLLEARSKGAEEPWRIVCPSFYPNKALNTSR